MFTEWQNFGITDMLETVYFPKTVLQGYKKVHNPKNPGLVSCYQIAANFDVQHFQKDNCTRKDSDQPAQMCSLIRVCWALYGLPTFKGSQPILA